MLAHLLVDFWGNDMSGMEPILIGAALGAGTSAITGGDPLTGALIGGATGGFGSGIGGAAGGAGGGASPLATAGTSSFASAAPVLPPSGAIGPLTYGSITPTEFIGLPFGEQLGLAGQSLSGLADIDLSKLSGMGNMMGGQQQQQQPSLTPAPALRGQPVNMNDPILSLLEEQRRPQQRGRISLLDER